jgi:hypothetical protein
LRYSVNNNLWINHLPTFLLLPLPALNFHFFLQFLFQLYAFE